MDQAEVIFVYNENPFFYQQNSQNLKSRSHLIQVFTDFPVMDFTARHQSTPEHQGLGAPAQERLSQGLCQDRPCWPCCQAPGMAPGSRDAGLWRKLGVSSLFSPCDETPRPGPSPVAAVHKQCPDCPRLLGLSQKRSHCVCIN